MNSQPNTKSVEKGIVISFCLIMLVGLVYGSQLSRSEKYKVYPEQIIKGINDAREGKK